MFSVDEESPHGLSHLVEAATALAELTSISQSPVASTSATGVRHAVSDEDETTAPPVKPTVAAPSSTSASKQIFPERLMEILDDGSLSDIITWLPHGRSFVIVRPDVFMEEVLPKYLPPADARASTKYPSFTRKLNRWGFRQATRGPDTGAFHHALFRRDKRELCLEMVCQRSRSKKNLPHKKRLITLTKESLDQMAQQQTLPIAPLTTTNEMNAQLSSFNNSLATTAINYNGGAAVSVSEDSQSMQSGLVSHNGQGGVRANSHAIAVLAHPTLAQRALAKRNEQERMRVAKTMLYHSYLQAIQQPAK